MSSTPSTSRPRAGAYEALKAAGKEKGACSSSRSTAVAPASRTSRQGSSARPRSSIRWKMAAMALEAIVKFCQGRHEAEDGPGGFYDTGADAHHRQARRWRALDLGRGRPETLLGLVLSLPDYDAEQESNRLTVALLCYCGGRAVSEEAWRTRRTVRRRVSARTAGAQQVAAFEEEQASSPSGAAFPARLSDDRSLHRPGSRHLFFSLRRRREILRPVQPVARPAAGHHHRHPRHRADADDPDRRHRSFGRRHDDPVLGGHGPNGGRLRRAGGDRLPARPARRMLCGLINGVIVTLLSLPPFIVTLGTWRSSAPSTSSIRAAKPSASRTSRRRRRSCSGPARSSNLTTSR